MGEVVVCVFLVFFPKWLGLNKKDFKACKEIGENGRKQSNSPEIKQNELQENKDKGMRKMLNKNRVSTKSKYKEWNKLILEQENIITIEKFTKGVQHQIWSGRRKNQHYKYRSFESWIRVKRKKNEECK